MKLVFARAEVAAALGQSPENFDTLLPLLESEGFPKPVRGLSQCWSIMDVITWVNRNTTFAQREKEGPAVQRWENAFALLSLGEGKPK
jgi:hypothetical protein